MSPEINFDWTDWPSWYAGRELGNRDLKALEHFLLCRSRIIDEDSFGIDFVSDYRQSFGATWNPDSRIWSITVRRLRAVTPLGQPIWLDETPVVIELPEESHDGEVNVYLPNSSIDLWLSVENPEPISKDLGVPKLKLRVRPEPRNQQPISEGAGLELYLGRHKLLDQGLELVRRPIVRRLCAFGPIDAAWDSWVSPLRARLHRLHAINGLTPSMAASVASFAIAYLSYEFPFLPLSSLVRQLRTIEFLLSNPGDQLWPLVKAAREEVGDHWTGEELPQQLAALLPDPTIRTTSPSNEFAGTFLQLVRSLDSGVEFHAPVGLLHTWQLGLSGYLNANPSDSDERLTKSVLEAVPTSDWSRAVVMITTMILNRTDRNNETAIHLDKLYTAQVKAQAPAGPMAFYWLAKAAIQLAMFPQACSTSLTDYCKAVRGSVVPARTDRIRRYLDRLRIDPKKNKPVRHYSLSPDRSRQRATAFSGDIRCTILGLKDSGKTTLASAIRRYWRDIEREIKLLDVVECTPSQFEAGALTDLLILTVSPNQTDSVSSADELDSAASKIANASPFCKVAIGYTRADEYGTIDFADIQVARQGQLPWRTDREFLEFLDGQKSSGVAVVSVPGFDYRTPEGSFAKGTSTRRHVLTATKQLWHADSGFAENLLNGYFLTAGPAADAPDEYLARTPDRSGIPHLIGDFLSCRKGHSS